VKTDIAIGLVIIINVVGIACVDDTSTGGTVSVVAVVTVLTEGKTVGSSIIVIPDTFAAALTFGGVAGDAVRTKEMFGKFEDVLGGSCTIADGACSVGHDILPRKMKITQPDWLGFMEIICS